ncbi:kinase-like domain-containing protein [Massariosphaeria phaeospora]|uniref:Kinase-like domain-containing protein n=1 Tax=Massariosphaeria phaeospora TaxID=100035 RepID=A0A7C8I235_9PLEO|nr:kinase-like domain-containing protein [Massariosphaeria phaeospora]
MEAKNTPDMSIPTLEALPLPQLMHDLALPWLNGHYIEVPDSLYYVEDPHGTINFTPINSSHEEIPTPTRYNVEVRIGEAIEAAFVFVVRLEDNGLWVSEEEEVDRGDSEVKALTRDDGEEDIPESYISDEPEGNISVLLWAHNGSFFALSNDPSTGADVSVQLFPNKVAISIIDNLFTNEFDLQPLRHDELPAALSKWTQIHMEYYWHAEELPLTRWRDVQVTSVHERDVEVTNAYTDDWQGGRWHWLKLERGQITPGAITRGEKRLVQLWVFYEKDGSRSTMFWEEDARPLYERFDGLEKKWYKIIHRPVGAGQHLSDHLQHHFSTPVDQQWVFVRPSFYSERSGVAMVVCKDEHDLIRNRVVVKHLRKLNTEGNPMNDLSAAAFDPRELYLHRVLSMVYPDDPNVLNLITSSFHDSELYLPWKLYLEYAPHGTLWDPAADAYMNSRVLPETFIWHVFRSLVDACVNLRSLGSECIHADMKLLNVFLGMPNPSAWPSYPNPKLADFGVYYWLGQEQIENACGTAGYHAPEAFGPYPRSPVRTDVWAIGIIVWCLMRKHPEGLRLDEYFQPPLVDDRARVGVRQKLLEKDAAVGYDELYSRRLEELVAWCLEEDLAMRPSMETLEQKVDAGAQAWDDANGKFMLGEKHGPLPAWMRVNGRLDTEFPLGGTAKLDPTATGLEKTRSGQQRVNLGGHLVNVPDEGAAAHLPDTQRPGDAQNFANAPAEARDQGIPMDQVVADLLARYRHAPDAMRREKYGGREGQGRAPPADVQQAQQPARNRLAQESLDDDDLDLIGQAPQPQPPLAGNAGGLGGAAAVPAWALRSSSKRRKIVQSSNGGGRPVVRLPGAQAQPQVPEYDPDDFF